MMAAEKRSTASFMKRRKQTVTDEKQNDQLPKQNQRRLCLIGVDEAGRGPLAGPLTTAACWLDEDWEPDKKEEVQLYKNLRDSKKYLTSSKKQLKERKDACNLLMNESKTVNPGVLYSLTFISVKEIDETHNILFSTYEGWVKDVKTVTEQLKKRFANEEIDIRVIIDGNRIPPELITMMSEQFLVESQVKADETVKAVSAASVIAKENRDQVMIELSKQYPEYGFEKHKGYGTDYHTKKLHQYGKCPIHRYFKIPALKKDDEGKKKRTFKKLIELDEDSDQDGNNDE
jgi:ribonuclease HII